MLQGFYDPCPGEAKQLEIVYQFKGAMHSVVVDDNQSVSAPLRGECSGRSLHACLCFS